MDKTTVWSNVGAATIVFSVFYAGFTQLAQLSMPMPKQEVIEITFDPLPNTPEVIESVTKRSDLDSPSLIPDKETVSSEGPVATSEDSQPILEDSKLAPPQATGKLESSEAHDQTDLQEMTPEIAQAPLKEPDEQRNETSSELTDPDGALPALKEERQSVSADEAAAFRSCLQKKARYPKISGRSKPRGKVVVLINIAEGQIISVDIEKSSGSKILDDASKSNVFNSGCGSLIGTGWLTGAYVY